MKNLLIPLFFLGATMAFSQESKKVTTYNYGYNGMEYIVQSTNETTIVSTFNSKHKIKDEVAAKVYSQTKESNLKSGDTLVISTDFATVTGKFYVQKSGRLTAINFYYEKVEWKDGLTELYVKKG